MADTLAETRRQAEEAVERLEGEKAASKRQRGDDEAELRRLATSLR